MSTIIAITGAGSGLGRALALEWAKRDAALSLFDRDEAGLKETVAFCRSTAGEPLIFKGDVTVSEDSHAWMEKTVERFGRLDALVACAGISMWARFDEVTDLSVFRRLMEVNYLGVVHAAHAALPHLKQTRGSLVAISSIQGKIGVPLHTGYAASKHAVEGFLNSLRCELRGSGINILTVCPHWMTGTNLRAHALSAGGAALGAAQRKHDNKEAVPVEVVAARIIAAMQQRRRELVLPFKLRLLPWLKLISPGLVERLVSGRVEKQEKSK